MKTYHVLCGVEIFLLAALPSWLQSPTGIQFLHAHMAIADGIGAAYVGFRAVSLAMKQNPKTPAEPAKEQQ